MKKLLIIFFFLSFTYISMAQVGIGTSTPDSSARLQIDANAATNAKGFLLPRVTATEKNSIVTPATGLIVYQTDGTQGFYYYDGALWNLFSVSNTAHTIGESYGGGIVFYVTTNGLHGLIAETQDQSSSCSWYNAQDIISTTANHSTAGKLYTDWRLPTKYELNLLYLQKSAVGGFSDFNYWSSTEFANFNAWIQNFDDGNQLINNKTNTFYVRAVRAF